MNEFRRDPLTGRIVIISTARDTRPNQFLRAIAREQVPNGADVCQFCASQMDTPPIIAGYGQCNHAEGSWQVCVVPNLFPSLRPRVNGAGEDCSGLGPFETTTADGLHEVVIESPTHVTRSGNLSAELLQLALCAYRDRMQFMLQQRKVSYVQVIKNSGEAAGASVKHCHSQIFALPFVPEQIQRELDGAADYFSIHRNCVFCDTLQHELDANQRVVAATESFVAWCPHASRVGYEIHIAPREHQARFEETSDDALEGLAAILHLILRRIDDHPRIDAFNYLLHSLPFDTNRNDQYHWHIEIIPRIAKEAGFEWGTGVHINTIAPEQAASELRD